MPRMPPDRTTGEMFERSVATLVRSWAYLATGSPGAEVIKTDGATVAAFVELPERRFLNNVLLDRSLADPAATIDAVERAYAERGIDRYAVWVHESQGAPVAAELEARGYVYESSTRTMAMPIDGLLAADTSQLDLVEATLPEFWRIQGLEGLLPDLPPEPAHIYVARVGGEGVTTLMAFDHDGDCGIYMVGTLPRARRRGLGTALSAHAVAEAARRGCTSVSLQSTPMAERVYARVGFRDLGRFDEYVPGPAS
jgi:GNAT superfamily N-acetyltransferase